MRYFVTGGAGFVGAHLVERLLSEESDVIAYDNLSTGSRDRLTPFFANSRFEFIEGDVLDTTLLTGALKKTDVVFHLAANSDIRLSENDPAVELEQGIIATFSVLQTMKENSVPRIVFTSSSTIYGDAAGREVTEDFGPLMPISLYGASKLAAEALISGFCHMFGMKGWIFRFANIVGRNPTHGVILDFIRSLRNNPGQLQILGNGKQSKPYLHVTECLDGILYGLRNSDQTINIFNLCPPDAVSVDHIARMVVEEMRLKNVAFIYTGGDAGWKGDVPRVRLKDDTLRKLGWRAKMTSEQAVRIAVREVLSQDDAFR